MFLLISYDFNMQQDNLEYERYIIICLSLFIRLRVRQFVIMGKISLTFLRFLDIFEIEDILKNKEVNMLGKSWKNYEIWKMYPNNDSAWILKFMKFIKLNIAKALRAHKVKFARINSS